MRIPKEISQALKKRTKAADDLNTADCIVTDFIEANGIAVDQADYMMYAPLRVSSESVKL